MQSFRVWKWLDHLGDFATKNVHVLRDAWAPFLLWCVIAAASVWWIDGKIYDNQIANLQSDKGTLTTRVSVLDGEIRDLTNKLADAEKRAAEPIDKRTNPTGMTGAVNGNVTAGSIGQTGGVTNVIVNQGPKRLRFTDDLGKALLNAMLIKKPIDLWAIGSDTDQSVANDIQKFLENSGYIIANRRNIGIIGPPPSKKITLADEGDHYFMTIAPSAE